MRLELTPEQSEVIRPLIRQCDADSLTPRAIIAQFTPGDWKAPDQIFVVYTTISVPLTRRIRKLIDAEREKERTPATEKSAEPTK